MLFEVLAQRVCSELTGASQLISCCLCFFFRESTKLLRRLFMVFH